MYKARNRVIAFIIISLKNLKNLECKIDCPLMLVNIYYCLIKLIEELYGRIYIYK